MWMRGNLFVGHSRKEAARRRECVSSLLRVFMIYLSTGTLYELSFARPPDQASVEVRTNKQKREMILNLFYTVSKCECERLRNEKRKIDGHFGCFSILYIPFLFYFANYFISNSLLRKRKCSRHGLNNLARDSRWWMNYSKITRNH